MIVQFWIKTKNQSIATTFFVDGRKRGWHDESMHKCVKWRMKTVPIDGPVQYGMRVLGEGRPKWDRKKR